MNIYENFAVIDLFCGVGGLTHGLVKEGFNVLKGIDFDNTCKYAYQANNKGAEFLHKDLKNMPASEIDALYPKGKFKILVGCAPCQDFSVYNLKNNKKNEKEEEEKKKNEEKEPKYLLLRKFAEIIDTIEPDIVSMENVPHLLKYKYKDEAGQEIDVFTDFYGILAKKYNIDYKIVNTKDYGIPQRRKRVILLACKKDRGNIEIISPSEFKESGVEFIHTVRQAIGDLEAIEAGEVSQKDTLHRTRSLSDRNKQRIQATKEGGFWRDWPEELLLECHKRDAGKSFRSVYGRMVWEDVAPTITTYCVGLGNGRFGHPEQDRAISLREAAIFQSFPKDYKFINPEKFVGIMTIARHIGNAVPVNLGRVIGQSIKKHITNTNYGKKHSQMAF